MSLVYLQRLKSAEVVLAGRWGARGLHSGRRGFGAWSVAMVVVTRRNTRKAVGRSGKLALSSNLKYVAGRSKRV
jgi:hypothetical protein